MPELTVAQKIAAFLKPFFDRGELEGKGAVDLFELLMPNFADAKRSDLTDALLLLMEAEAAND